MAVHTIVVGTDGSEGSLRAVVWVAELAARLPEVTVVLVHAIGLLTHITPTPEPSGPHSEEILELLRGEWSAPLRSTGATVRHVARAGDPVGVLLTVGAEVGADLLVVGSRGAGAPVGVTLGSTSQQVVHDSTVPVLVVPPSLPA